ncbi:hypothetical protein Droror1_Dr00007915 [Drosera rotundifolia]
MAVSLPEEEQALWPPPAEEMRAVVWLSEEERLRMERAPFLVKERIKSCAAEEEKRVAEEKKHAGKDAVQSPAVPDHTVVAILRRLVPVHFNRHDSFPSSTARRNQRTRESSSPSLFGIEVLCFEKRPSSPWKEKRPNSWGGTAGLVLLDLKSAALAREGSSWNLRDLQTSSSWGRHIKERHQKKRAQQPAGLFHFCERNPELHFL